MAFTNVKNSVSILSAVALFLLTIEYLLRAALPVDTTIALQYDKDYMISMKPNITQTFTRSKENGGDVIRWETNADSFRGRALRDSPGMRIIVYGDSNIFARFSDLEHTFPFKLEHYLKERGLLDVEVINAGVVGSGPDQSLIRFFREMNTYNPDLVIFNVYADNDFGDLIRNRLFELDKEGRLVATPYPKSVDQLLRQHAELTAFPSSLRILTYLKRILKAAQEQYQPSRHSLHFGKQELILFRTLNSLDEEYYIYKLSRPRYFSHFDDRYDLDVAAFPDAESAKVKVQLLGAVLKRAQAEADQRHIAFLVVIQPASWDLTKNYSVNYAYLSEHFPKYSRRNLTEAVRQSCITNKIDFVDLFDGFLQHQPESLYFRGDDSHWNDAGQDLAAKQTAAHITTRLTHGQRRTMLTLN